MNFINKSEYWRLFEEEMDNPVSVQLFGVNLIMDNFVNHIFEENKFLYGIFFFSQYDILKYDSSNSSIHFDHCIAIQLKSNVSHISDFETITGIGAFLYDDWNVIKKYFECIPENWSQFIINPILMKYESKSIGIFLTPKYSNDFFIDECNNFIRSRTGYPLFLKYIDNQNIPKIIFDKPVLSLKNYVNEMKKTANKGLSKLIDFWAENDCVSVNSFEYNFDSYKDNLYYQMWEDIDLKDIYSTIPFEIVHEKTGESLGKFKKFNLDKTFNLAYVDNGVLKLSNNQINELIKGNFDFILVY